MGDNLFSGLGQLGLGDLEGVGVFEEEKKEEKKISIFDIPDIDGQESIFDIFKNL